MHRIQRPTLLFPFLLFAACADGGTTDVPQSEVQIAGNHNVVWFRSLPGFGSATTRPLAVNSGHATLAMATDSTYTLQFPSGSSSSQERYAIDNSAKLSIYQTGSGRNPSTVFQGGYQLVGARPDFCFTDRVSAGDSTSVGLYFGARAILGQDELEGPWHLFSMHVMMQSGGVQTPRTVARAAFGEVSVAAGAAGSLRTISGTGFESGADPSTVPVTFSGQVQNLLDGSQQGTGVCNLTVGYTNTGTPTDSRVFWAAAGSDLLFAVDEDETDTASGLLAMVRKFDAPTSSADPTRIAGTFYIGGYTAFVNPTNAGSDAFVGEMVLTQQNGIRIDGVDHRGVDFSYTGTWNWNVDGAVTMQINGNGGETWRGACARSYDTLIFVDPVVEVRTNNTPELNFVHCVRKRSNP
ncbi:MAG: hypothetical protein ABL997_05740 [Planctomycetota bacterium]